MDVMLGVGCEIDRVKIMRRFFFWIVGGLNGIVADLLNLLC